MPTESAAPKFNTFLNRAKFRSFLRRNDDEDCCAALLDNSKNFNNAFESLHEQHANEKGGKLTDFFTWLLAHQAEIIAFIKLLFGL